MIIAVHKLVPLLIVGGVAFHGKNAIAMRAKTLIAKQSTFIVSHNMNVILKSIRVHNIGEMQVNFGNDPQAYIRKIAELNGSGDPSIDPWGTPFRLFQSGNNIYIVSAGKDRSFNSGDDIQRGIALLNY